MHIITCNYLQIVSKICIIVMYVCFVLAYFHLEGLEAALTFKFNGKQFSYMIWYQLYTFWYIDY